MREESSRSRVSRKTSGCARDTGGQTLLGNASCRAGDARRHAGFRCQRPTGTLTRVVEGVAGGSAFHDSAPSSISSTSTPAPTPRCRDARWSSPTRNPRGTTTLSVSHPGLRNGPGRGHRPCGMEYSPPSGRRRTGLGGGRVVSFAKHGRTNGGKGSPSVGFSGKRSVLDDGNT